MPDAENNPVGELEARDAALRAGWDGIGLTPEGHGVPPDVDPELGHNGIAPTDAERIA